MHRLKVAQGRASGRRAYEPLDLFSGDATRMKMALQALLDEPHNNFAIPVQAKDLLIELLAAILLQSDVLERLLALQRLDRFDIAGIYPAAEAYQHRTAADSMPGSMTALPQFLTTAGTRC
ncbi:hypothetical protein WJX73_008277 [Symbiochloris irregularis]|uniref:Inositol-pentakisphosphate 2-kinase n=1 Tax=Symbiochloris irregularis TaxID=706552 RepID=A0AAW1PW65_9CHLO